MIVLQGEQNVIKGRSNKIWVFLLLLFNFSAESWA